MTDYILVKRNIQYDNFFIFFTGFSFFVKEPRNQVDFEAESWPVTDEEGYYQSYKENGKFVNWWHKDMPSFVQILDGWDIKARHLFVNKD